MSGDCGEGRCLDAYTAAALGHLDQLQNLVRLRNVNLKNISGWTLLMYACYYNRVDTVEFLVLKGADKRIKCNKGRNALMTAACNGNVSLMELVFQNDIIESKDESGNTPLCIAVEHGHTNATEYLLSKGADTNIFLENHETPLMCAARKGSYSLVKALLRYEANTSVLNNEGKTAKDIALENGYGEIVQLIITYEEATIESILHNIGLEHYLRIFESNMISFEEFLEMSEEDMRIIGITLFGPRRKISMYMNSIKGRYFKNITRNEKQY